MPPSMRPAALVVAVALLVAACGARLTPQQRAAAIRGGSTATSGTAVGEQGPADGPVQFGPGAGTGPASGDPRRGRRQGGDGPGGSAGRGAGAVDNGGATDVGVTGDELIIANVSDITGPSPGLFRSAQQATQAFAAYVNSQGGIHGRSLRVLALDSRTDTGGNKEATLEACDRAFALVGSMAAFDNGGTEAIDGCGIPDVSAIPTARHPARPGSLSFPAYPNRPDVQILGIARYIKERYPQAIRKAALLYLNTSTTIAYAGLRRAAYESIGFDFVVYRQVQVVEPNYVPYVLEMQGRGVEYVSMVADAQSIAQLLKAMQQQGFRPAVRDWDSVAYSSDFLHGAGQAADGSLVYLNNAMFEEASGNRELQLYRSWLQRVAPGAEPDYFGLFAWSAGRLFERALRAAGPRATRAGLIEQLRRIESWNGHGLHPANDIGGRLAAACFLYAEVRGGRFVRRDPARGYLCRPGDYYRRGA